MCSQDIEDQVIEISDNVEKRKRRKKQIVCPRPEPYIFETTDEEERLRSFREWQGGPPVKSVRLLTGTQLGGVRDVEEPGHPEFGDDFFFPMAHSSFQSMPGSPPSPGSAPPPAPKLPDISVLSPTKQRRNESILEWFDKAVEDAVKKRVLSSTASPKLNLSDTTGTGHSLMAESTVDSFDLEMRGAAETDMDDAIDCLIKAQTLVEFEGAVRAAEEAAASVPPDQAEEAAVAGAKGYQAELTSVIKQKVPGVKPVEVIGYVGITRPKFRKRRM